MRILLWTLLLVAPLLAQEAEEKKPAEPAKQDKAAEIRKLVETFFDGKDEKELDDLEKRLRALLKDDNPFFKFKPVTAREVFVFGSPAGQETINGSSDGTSYTMKSLGGGRYKLTAKKLGDAETKEITDEGTLKDLRKKYPFLKGGLFAVGVPTRVAALDSLRRWPQAPRSQLGMLVRPPSESLSHHLELPTGAGLVVGSVTKGSRAEKLGLKEHDVLLRIDGELIDSPDQLKRLDENKGVLVYVRRAKPRTLDLSKLADDEK